MFVSLFLSFDYTFRVLAHNKCQCGVSTAMSLLVYDRWWRVFYFTTNVNQAMGCFIYSP